MGLNHDIFKNIPELFDYFLIQKASRASFFLLKSSARTHFFSFWKREFGANQKVKKRGVLLQSFLNSSEDLLNLLVAVHVAVAILFGMNDSSVDSHFESAALRIVRVVLLRDFLARNGHFVGAEFVQNLSLNSMRSMLEFSDYLEMLKFWTVVSYATKLNVN